MPGPDQQYEVLNNFYAWNDSLFKVIRLKQPIQVFTNQTLAVSYVARPVIGAGHQLGAADSVGGVADTDGTLLLKLLRVPRQLQKPTSDGVRYETKLDSIAPLAKVRELELKNVYNLNGYGIDPKSFKLQVRRGQQEPPITDLNGIPFIEALGLDNWNEQTSQATRGHDGQVDATGINSQTRGFVDYTNGVLVLPDLRPFAPARHQWLRARDRGQAQSPSALRRRGRGAQLGQPRRLRAVQSAAQGCAVLLRARVCRGAFGRQ
jgi:cell surface protein SprA